MKKLLLMTILSTIITGNLWAQMPDISLSFEGVEVENLDNTLKIKIMAQWGAKFAGKEFEQVHLPGTFANKSTVIELSLDKEKARCHILEEEDLIECSPSNTEANIVVSNGEGKILLNKEFRFVRFQIRRRILTYTGPDVNGNSELRSEESKVIHLEGDAKDGSGELEVKVSKLLRWIE